MTQESSTVTNTIEIRCFNFLREIHAERNWAYPYIYKLDKEVTAKELANALNLPLDKIEAVFVNGLADALENATVKPGDRVAFLPPGTPGPYRVLLGIKKLSGSPE